MRPEHHRYGPLRSQVAELWRPPGLDSAAARPAVVLIHGGYWRAPYTKRLMHPLARAIALQGWFAWNVEYRRTGWRGGGGGWPGTLGDVAAAIDALATVEGIDLRRVAALGHSAGGQLALWAAARPGLPPDAPGASPTVTLRAAVSLAGVVDLVAGANLGLGAGAVSAFLGGGPAQYPERYRLASPALRLPLGVPHALIHGGADQTVPVSMSEHYAAAARAAGDDAELVVVEGVGHRDVISPRSAAWEPTVDVLRRWLLDADSDG